MTKIGIIGPSHMGLVWSAVLADKGFLTYYFKSLRPEVYESGLQELIEKNIGKNLQYKKSYSSLNECEVVFMAYDTPITDDNKIKLDLIKRVINAIIPNLNDTAIFVIMSQIPPGFMRSIDFDNLRLVYQVDTLIFGSSIEKALNPELFVIGTEDGMYPATIGFGNYYDLLGKFCCERIQLSFEEAEIFKLAMNANLAAQIAVTNTMAELCTYYDAHWPWIADALKFDKRIGSYTKPGLGVSGGHLMRDLYTIELLSRKHGFHSDIIGGSIASSHHMRYWAVRQLRRLGYNLTERKIAIWGLSYKEGTDSIKDSPAIFTINEFPNCTFLAHDPQAKVSLPNVTMVKDPLDAIEEYTESLLIMTPHEEYKDIKLDEDWRKPIIDPFNTLNNIPEHCLHWRL